MKKRMSIFTVLIFACALALSVSGCAGFKNENNKTKDSAEEKSIVVETDKVRIRDIVLTSQFWGRLKPIREIPVIPKMPGEVARVYVKVGQPVKKGDVLLELDGSDVEAQIAQARAAYNVTKASVDLSRSRLYDLEKQKKDIEDAINSIDENIRQIDKTIEEIQQKLEGTQDTPPIQQEVATDNSASDTPGAGEASNDDVDIHAQLEQLNQQKQQLLDQKMQLEEGKKSVENAIKSLPYNHRTLDSQLNQAKTALDAAESAVENLELRSPIDGVVSAVMVEESAMAGQSVPPVTVIDTSKLVLDVSVTEFDVSRFQEGQFVDVCVDALEDSKFNGVIDFISPSTDSRLQAYVVRIVIDNSDGRLKPGMFARIQLVTEKKTSVVAVPKKSMIRRSGHSYVFVVEKGRAYMREVVTGLDDGEWVEIVSGVAAGEEVVVEGEQFLKDGSRVEIVRGDAE